MGNTVEQWRASIGGWTRGGTLMADTKNRESSDSPWFNLLVIIVLLVIAGIEMNPGPLQVKKKTGVADMTGELFKIKMAVLLFLRGIKSERKFQIAFNMAAAGSFHDLVFILGHQTVFLHFKHRHNKNAKVYPSQLLTIKGDFSIFKHYKSYLDIKQQSQINEDLKHCGRFEDFLFFIFTNAEFDGTSSDVGSNEMYDLVKTKDVLIQFTEQQHGWIYREFESLPRYKQILSEVVSGKQASDTPEVLEVVWKLLNNTAKNVPNKNVLIKLLTDLKSLEDLSGYREFLSRLYLFTGQAGESSLDNFIRSALNTIFGNDTYFLELLKGIEDWWRKSNVYLTNQAKFFQDIIQKMAAGITEDVSDLKVKFVKEECDSMRQKLTSDSRMLYIHTECISLTSVKVMQSFQTNLLIKVTTLRTHLSEVLAVWKLGLCNILVVEGETTDTNILSELADMPDSKYMVMISSTKHTQLHQQFNFVSFTDTFCLSQLETDSQFEILGREVMFQGLQVKLNSLADNSFFQNYVTADVVVQLHKTLQIGQKLNDLDPCYISRTFLRREYVSEQVFGEENITLAITGISEEKLIHLIPSGEKIQKFNVNNFITDESCRYFLTEREAEFTALCAINDNIHWIQACEGNFLWKKSKGDMSPVLKHINQKCVEYIGAKEILTLPHRMILIVAEPGMGKTTEVCNFAHVIKQNDPSTWVVVVDLNQHIPHLSQKQRGTVEFLEMVATLETEFQKRLFEHQLQSGGNVVIFLDGFDEIDPNYSEKVFWLLRELSLISVNKIFSTSRPIILQKLQQKLSTIPFSFRPFTSKDQEYFLAKHWNQSCKNSFKLSNFVSSLLELVKNSLINELKQFAGIPLQTRLMAEVFQDDASHYCQTDEIRLPKNLDVLQLYDKFVDKKWEVYYKKLDLDEKIYVQTEQTQKFQYQQNLMNCAMFSYLDESYIRRLHNTNKILEQNEEVVKRFDSGLDKIGIIIDIINDKAVFIHRTFTEYFVAMWYSKHFDLELNNIKIIYINKNFEIVQMFLHRMLAQQFQLHTAVLNKDLPKIKHLLSKQKVNVNEKDKGGNTALHLAIMNCFYINDNTNESIMETLLEYGADFNCKDRVFNWRPLRLAEEIRAWSMIEKLLEKQADSTDLLWIRANIEKKLCVQNSLQVGEIQDFVQSEISGSDSRMSDLYCMNELLQDVMFVALSEGYVNLVQYLVKCGITLHQHITDRFGYKTPMLHIATEHGQLRLVQFLINHGVDVEMCDRHKRTSLMQAAVHGYVQVAETLINHGASVDARDKDGDTALSLAVRMGEHKIVELLLQKGSNVELTDTANRTPLRWAAFYGHVEIVELLINHAASVNVTDNQGGTALSLAGGLGKYEVVELLLKNGADVEISDIAKRTPLFCAALNGEVKVAELLINHGACVNTRALQGDTTLSVAARSGNHEVVELLLKLGADPELSDRDSRTPLLKAAEHSHTQVLECLIKYGSVVNATDRNGDTAISLATRLGKYEVVDLLLKLGADVEIPDKDNRTSLMQAAMHGHLQIVKLLMKYGASVNARDRLGDTAFSLAAQEGRCEVVDLLLKNGVDIEISDNDKRTPLIKASERGHIKVVEILVSYGASVNARTLYGDTTLAVAARLGKYEIVKMVLQKGADVKTSDTDNRSPLWWATYCGDMQIVKLLINHGLSVNERDSEGETALSLAVRLGNYEVVGQLLELGANFEIYDNEKRTPLIRASEYGHVKIVEILILQGASVNARDIEGATALSVAVHGGKSEIKELLLKNGAEIEISNKPNRTSLRWGDVDTYKQILELIISCGVSVNARDEAGHTPLSLAISKGKYEVVKLLLQNGASIEKCDKEKRTPLRLATLHGHVQMVELLISHGASVNSVDINGRSALSLAALKGKTEIIELLSRNGAEIDIPDLAKRTPLVLAAREGHVQAAKILINHGANLNKKACEGDTPLSVASRLGKCGIVELLTKLGADIELPDRDNRTPLIKAAEYGQAKTAEILIKHGSSINATDTDGLTALSFAARLGFYEVVKILLQFGADIELSDRNNKTPLMQAAVHGNNQIIELLLKHGASINVTDRNGETVLSLTAGLGKHQIVPLLLQKGADVTISDKDMRTPVMKAAVHNYMEIVEFLLNHQAYINERDCDGNTALLLAAKEGKFEVVKLLLEKGADVEISDTVKRTPLFWAALNGHVNIVVILISHGAFINARTVQGDTTLAVAASSGKYEVVELLLKLGAHTELSDRDSRTPLLKAAECGHTQVLDLLIKHGAVVNARDKDGNTALSLAAHLGKYEVVNLLSNLTDIDMSDKDNRTPLMKAAVCGHAQIAELLINHKAAVNARDRYGDTALSLACHLGKYEVVELLLQRGSDVEISNKDNRTPLMQAAVHDHVQIVELLINNGASVNVRDSDGDTALSLATHMGKHMVSDLLLRNGADVDM